MKVRIVAEEDRCVFHITMQETRPNSPAGYIVMFVLGQASPEGVFLDVCEPCAALYERMVKSQNSNLGAARLMALFSKS